MKKYLLLFLVACLTAMLTFAACGEEEPIETPSASSEEPTSTEEPTPTYPSEVDGVLSFGKWFNTNEMISLVPVPVGGAMSVKELADVGDEHFQVDVDNATVEDYWAYNSYLQELGWEEIINNGDAGMEGFVYCFTVSKDGYMLNVTYLAELLKMYICISPEEKDPISDYLFYNEEDVAANVWGSKTKLYMRELYDFGNGYVFQLKNGHFFINDGGMYEDGDNLIQLLQSLVPAGEIPVIDVMLITHAHEDHGGFLAALIENDAYADMIRVNEIWFSTPSERIQKATNMDTPVLRYISMFSYIFSTEDGDDVKIVRPHMGQRFYIDDIVADCILTQEQLPLEDQSGDCNDTSTWFMYYIEGQKLLFGGDGDWGGMSRIMQAYSSEFISCDIFHILHHGYNTWEVFSDFCKCRIAIDSAPVMKTDAYGGTCNKLLQPLVQEWINWGSGTKVLTFPYTPGTTQTLPHIEEYIHA